MVAMTKEEKIKWILSRHEETRHMYDKYLPYEFHLRMTVQVFNTFKHLLPKEMYTYIVTPQVIDITHLVIELACWGHDLIEDTRTNYNDCKILNVGRDNDVNELIFALTNEKGRNRAERGSDKYYNGILEVPGATFVKLCDRISNVQYSRMSGSRMFDLYKKENNDFLKKLNYSASSPYYEMFNYLISIYE